MAWSSQPLRLADCSCGLCRSTGSSTCQTNSCLCNGHGFRSRTWKWSCSCARARPRTEGDVEKVRPSQNDISSFSFRWNKQKRKRKRQVSMPLAKKRTFENDLIMTSCGCNCCVAWVYRWRHTVIHFYFNSVQFSVKPKFAVSVRRQFRWRLAMGWAGPTTTSCCEI